MRSGFSIIVIAIALALLGLLLLPMLPVKLFPSHELPSLSVSFSMPGNSSRVVEQEVTSRIEGALARIKGVRKIESRSSAGWGSVAVSLDSRADIDMARTEVSSVIRQLWEGLPDGVTYPMVSTHRVNDESAGPFMTYTVISPLSPMEIDSYVGDRIVPLLSDIPGVSDVSIHGAYPSEWSVEYDSDRLSVLGLSPDDIVAAIRRHYGSEFLGMARAGGNLMRIVRKPQAQSSAFRASDIVITTPDGKSVRLDRLVKVRHSEGKPTSHFRINGLNSIYINITAEETANQIETSDAVAEKMCQVRESAPEDMRFILSSDLSEPIREELDKIYFRSALTVLILLLFMAVVTRDVRYTLLVTISLAINIAVALIFYSLLGTEIQLYSLAGITISLNLIIDNTIVMCDHYLRRRDRKVFPAILAATLTTAGALVVVFMLDEDVRLNLQDFVIVVVVNLLVSLAVALFLVPALADKIGMKWHRRRPGKRSCAVKFVISRLYGNYIKFALRRRWVFFILMAVIIGGSGWMFFDKVREGTYFRRDSDFEREIYINASLPNGATVAQMDALIRRMEEFLSGFNGIRQFETAVYSGQRGEITVRVDKKKGASFPYMLKSEIVAKALTLGGGSWNVYGLDDYGFNNDVRESAGSYRIKMIGFNYDELMDYANRLKDSLLSNKRIKEVAIRSDFSYWKDDYSEFRLEMRREALLRAGLTVSDLYMALNMVFGCDMEAGMVISGSYSEPIRISSLQSGSYDVWSLMNMPVDIRGKSFKLSDLAVFNKSQAPHDIVKENQSYRVCLQYEYIGSVRQGKRVLEETLTKFSDTLPAGYSAESDMQSPGWDGDKFSTYWLLALVALIIFFISAVLFNSLMRPLAIIAVIPMSYVGIFLTFRLFDLKFDQGGFASFILLSGITVNAAIYLINEYSGRKKRMPSRQSRQRRVALYLQSFRVKIMPILMTVLSTVFGFIPFLVDTDKEGFWFPLAAGTVSGLLFSLVAIVLYLPLLVLPGVSSRHEVGR